MALLCDEAARLNLPELKTKIIETHIVRGVGKMMNILQCVNRQAEELKVLYETPGEVGSSVANPTPDCGGQACSSVATTSRDSTPLTYTWKMLQRKAEIHHVHTIDTRYFDRMAVEIMKQYKYLITDFNDQLFNGLGVSGHMTGIEGQLNYIYDNYYTDTKIFHTEDATATGTPQSLSLAAVRKLISVARCIGGDSLKLVSDLESFNVVMTLLESAGGIQPAQIMAENFGVSVPYDGRYAGVDWVVNDAVGREKRTLVANTSEDGGGGEAWSWVNGSKTLTIAPTVDVGFIGFSDLDIGRTVSVVDANGAIAQTWNTGSNTTTVASVTNRNVVVMTDAADAGIPIGSFFKFHKTNAIYAVDFDEEYGFQWHYPESGVTARDGGMAGRCLSSVCGMSELYMGRLQDCPQTHRTFIELYGEFYNNSVDSIARLSHFDFVY